MRWSSIPRRQFAFAPDRVRPPRRSRAEHRRWQAAVLEDEEISRRERGHVGKGCNEHRGIASRSVVVPHQAPVIGVVEELARRLRSRRIRARHQRNRTAREQAATEAVRAKQDPVGSANKVGDLIRPVQGLAIVVWARIRRRGRNEWIEDAWFDLLRQVAWWIGARAGLRRGARIWPT